MTIETLIRAELAHELSYIDAEGQPSERAIAQSLRDALGRWGLSPRRALLKHARGQLRALDVPVHKVPKVLDKLMALGECAEMAVEHEPYVAPAESRWVAVGEGQAVLLGALVVSTERKVEGLPFDHIAVRVHLEGEEQAAALEARGARQVSLAEWLHPFGFMRYVARRTGSAVRADQWTLQKFWEHLVNLLGEEGNLLSPDAEVRAVMGMPGGFFGQHRAATLEGRWGEDLPSGVWCAYRRGHGDGHWLPTLVSADGEERRALDLFDDDEWRWALLARSHTIGPAEVIRRSGGEVIVTWPLPAQLRAAMDIVGIPSGPWRWRVAGSAPDLWELIR